MKNIRTMPILGSMTLAAAAFVQWVAWSNTALTTHNISIASKRLPDAFSGFRIAHISDLHNTAFGANNEKLLRLLKKAQPDIIVITGDLIDSRHTHSQIALAFVTEAAKIAPIYSVTGNHELRIYKTYQALACKMQAVGARLLQRETVSLERNGQFIQLVGMDDPTFYGRETYYEKNKLRFSQDLRALKTENTYTILLSHRPELFDLYVASGVDFICSGHTHGGQFRLPFLGGLYMPGQGLFPQYDGGLYTAGDTSMVVSRGLGNSSFPFRLNNRPELVVIELCCKK